jgi:hypothetical protein
MMILVRQQYDVVPLSIDFACVEPPLDDLMQ